MVNHAPGTVLDRAVRRFKHRLERGGGEPGSLVLDILIGMAIFALVAIIAVSAVGQYRMRAYTQAAMSDAEAVANAIQAAITDAATTDPTGPAYPTGLLTTDDFTSLEVTPTSSGTQVSAVTVAPNPANPEVFSVCVEYRGAYAEYLSDEGLISSGNIADDGFLGCDATFPDDTDGGDGGDGGDGDGGDEGDGDDTALAAPTNVNTDVPAEGTEATLTWDAVPGATGYTVTVDGDTTPAWTGTGTTATLTDLDPGEHTLTVTPTGPTGPGTPTTVTITTRCDNDALRCAHRVKITGAEDSWQTGDYTNASATTQSGENDDLSAKGMWWTYTAPVSGTMRVTITPANDGTGPFPYGSIYVWKSASKNITEVQSGLKQGTYRTSVIDFTAIEGETYKIRVGSTYGDVSKYRVRFQSGPAHDYVEEAIEVPTLTGGSWTSPNQSNDLSGFQAGETDNLGAPRGMWWSYTAETSGTTKVTMLPTTDGVGPVAYGGIWAWETTASTIAGVQAAPVKAQGYRTHAVSFDAVKGRTYKIRVGTTYNDVGRYRVRIEAPPANDNVENALTIPSLPANDSWTSSDQNNALAGYQAGETDGLGSAKGMWWTYTATTGGTTRVTIAPASDGSGPFPYGGIWSYETTATDIATVQTAPVKAQGYRTSQATFNAVQGQTYKIRIGSTYGDSGNFRVRLETGPGNDNVADATRVDALASGQSYTSANTGNDLAGSETGENSDLSAKGLWWTYTATTSGSLRVQVIATTDGATLPRPSIYAWDSTATTAAQVQTGTRYGDWSVSAITLPVAAGKTYKIRIGNVYGDVGRFRLKIDAQ